MNTDNKQTKDTASFIPETTPQLDLGSAWLRDKRQESRSVFNGSPLPPRGIHLWRYTDPSIFLSKHLTQDNTSITKSLDGPRSDLAAQLESNNISGLVTDHADQEITVQGIDAIIDQGVIVCSLAEAVEKHSEIAERHLYQLINSDTGKFEAMNCALWNQGIFVYVPDGVTVEKPLYLYREAPPGEQTQFPRLLVVVGENAELTLIDEYSGGGSENNCYANAVIEIFGKQYSRTRYVSLQQYHTGVSSYLTHRAQINQSATMLTIPLAFGGDTSKCNYGVTLNGQGAESDIFGLVFGTGRQHLDNHTLHHHVASETLSNIDLKVVLRDKATSAYTGLIRIENDAKTCEAYQVNRNLLLSSGTKADTIPELEILNEDVQCSHGATIGPIDPMSVFYLKSRGIEESAATRMIVAGFVGSTLKMLPVDLRENIRTIVANRLENL